MQRRVFFGLVFSCVICGLLFVGCARAARDTTGFSLEDGTTVEAPFETTWQAAKTVLREQELDIYTRDKRGVFVAYTPMKRRLLIPKRVKYTIELTEVDADSTRVHIETINQVYGVTLLTYPGWHDRKSSDNAGAQEILAGIQGKISGTSG